MRAGIGTLLTAVISCMVTVDDVWSGLCGTSHYWCQKTGSGLTYADPGFPVLTQVSFASCIYYCGTNSTCKALQWDSSQQECRFVSFLSGNDPYLSDTPATYEVLWKKSPDVKCPSVSHQGKVMQNIY